LFNKEKSKQLFNINIQSPYLRLKCPWSGIRNFQRHFTY